MKIGIIANQAKPEAVNLATEVIDFLQEKNIKTIYCDDIYFHESQISLLNDCNYIIVIGGDGTILSLVRLLGNRDIPILGINFGNLGFIAETDPSDYKIAINKLISGDYFISERIILKANIYKDNGTTYPDITTHYCLNEFVIGKGSNIRLISIDTYVNDEFLVNYKADGIIIACPTGSTAYNLSAGGPVMHPSIKAFAITPICPHTLSERPLIVPSEEVIKIKCSMSRDNLALFSIDGQYNEIMTSKDYVIITVADHTARLIEFKKTGFYDKLKTRLHWGE